MSSADGSVKKIILSTDKIYGIGPFAIGGNGNPHFVSLEEIVNKPTNGNEEWNINLGLSARKLKRLDLPNITVSSLSVGIAGGMLEYVEIDWANSSFSSRSEERRVG